MFYRRDILEAKGITADQVKSADDLMNLGKELTDAKGGVWAFDDVWTYLYHGLGRAAQKWKVEDGKLVHNYEMPEILEALDWHYRLATAGYVHPDALAGDNANGEHPLLLGQGADPGRRHRRLEPQRLPVRHRRATRTTGGTRSTSSPPTARPPRDLPGRLHQLMSYLNAKPEAGPDRGAAGGRRTTWPRPTARPSTRWSTTASRASTTPVQNGVPDLHRRGQEGRPAADVPVPGRAAGGDQQPGRRHVTKDYPAWQAAQVKTPTSRSSGA